MKKEFREILREKNLTALPNVLLASAECAPLSKTGGLADVVGTLPKSLAKLGIDARVITPYHRVIKDKYADRVENMFDFYCTLGWRQAYVGVEKLVLDGVTIYLIDNEQYFGDKIYRGGQAEGEQYAFFCRAVLDCIPNLDFTPQVLHCNDWHTAMLPMLAKTQYQGGMQAGLKFLLTIHNIAFQGKFGFDYVQDLLNVDSRYYTPEFMELNGCADFLKAGCVFADRINTVSPSYASEIKMPYYAEGLEGILNARSHELSGIINGIDKKVFNPHADKLLPATYDRGHLKGKAVCKAALQERMGLEQHPDVLAGAEQLTAVQRQIVALVDVVAVKVGIPGSVGDLHGVHGVQRLGQGSGIFLNTSLGGKAQHSGDALRNGLGGNDHHGLGGQGVYLLGSHDDVLVVGQDKDSLGRHLVHRLQNVLGAGVHGLAAGDDLIDAQILEHVREARTGADGDNAQRLLRLRDLRGDLLLGEHLFRVL